MCDPISDPLGCLTEGVGSVISAGANDALQELVNQVLEGVGKALASLGTMWVYVPTPVLTAGSASGDSSTPPGSEEFTEILGYISFIALMICALSIIGFAISFIVGARRGDGSRSIGRFGLVLIAVIMVSGASSLIATILPSAAPAGSSTTVGFLQSSLWYYVGAMAVASVVIGGIRMAWQQRAQPGKDLLQSLITLIVVSGVGLLVISLGVTAADAFSIWILNGATDCDVTDGTSQCFGTNLGALMGLTASSPLGLIGLLILGTIALLLSYVQVALMVVRGGLLVILAGILPLTAAFTNTEMGMQWFKRTIGWTIAFILYKPAAALVYAAAFSLSGSDAFQADGGGLWSILTGLALMTLALVALPTLLRLVAPMTSAVAGGGAAGMALAGGAGAIGGELATGAIQRGHSSSRQPSTAGAASGSQTASGAVSGGTAARGAAAKGAAAGGSSAAAAAGPVGIGVAAAGAVASGAGKAAQAAKGAATSAVEDQSGSSPTGA